MLEKPEIPDELIIASIQSEFGLTITHIEFLPLGGDLSSAVYQAVAEDGKTYFTKLRRGEFNGLSVELPKFLHEQGVEQIIPPLTTQSGQLWAEIGEFRLTLSPYMEGKSGFEKGLTQKHWAAFGKALQQIHSMPIPGWLAQKIEKEQFSAEWRIACGHILEKLENRTFDDPTIRRLVAYMEPKNEIIRNLLHHAERLAQIMRSREDEFVLCHGDIHPGNLFLDENGRLYIVDWDYPVLSLKERDLMFIGGGQGYIGTTALEEESFFYSYYQTMEIDRTAMAYYRCERNIIDFCVESSRILDTALGDKDREQSLEIISWLFLPDSSVAQAYRSLGQIWL